MQKIHFNQKLKEKYSYLVINSHNIKGNFRLKPAFDHNCFKD